MPNDVEQSRVNRAQRLQSRLAITRDRLKQRSRMQELRAVERTTIRVTVSKETAERAEEGCFANEGVNLTTWLKEAVGSFADVIPRDGLHRASKRYDTTDVTDQEWETVIKDYLGFIGDFMPTVSDILDQLDWPPGARDREALMRVGRIMKRLRCGKTQVYRNGKRVWVYRKPFISSLTPD
jgi:hypothetical protein